MKSLNQLHKECGTTASFKDWVTKGQEIFNDQKAAGVIPENTTFEWWANKVSESTLNVTGQPATETTTTTTAQKIDWANVFNSAKEVFTAAQPIVEQIKTGSTTSKTNTNLPGQPGVDPKPKTTILGMSVPVFATVTGVTVLLIGIGIWAIVRKNK
jgi:hypothetical protein